MDLELDDLPFPATIRHVDDDGTPGRYEGVNRAFLRLYNLYETPLDPKDFMGASAARGPDEMDARVVETASSVAYDLRFEGRTLHLEKRPILRDGRVAAILTVAVGEAPLGDVADLGRQWTGITEAGRQAVTLLEYDETESDEPIRIVSQNRFSLDVDAGLREARPLVAERAREALAESTEAAAGGVPDQREVAFAKRQYVVYSERVNEADEEPALVLQTVEDITESVRSQWLQRVMGIALARTTDDAIAEAFEIGRDLLDLPLGALLREEDGEVRVMAASRGVEPGGRLPLHDNYRIRLLDHRSRTFPSLEGRETPVADALGMRSTAVVPVVADGEPWGLLLLGAPQPRAEPFPELSTSMLDVLGNTIGVRIERDRARRRLVPVERLEESNRRLEEYAHAAAHDLRSPLRRIRSFAQLLEAQLGADEIDRARVADFAERISRGAAHLDDLLQSMLEHADVDHLAGEYAEWTDPLDRLSLIRSELETFDEEVDLEIGRLPEVRMPHEAVERVFRNLIENAIKYRHPDRRPRIRIEANPTEAGAVVRVVDNGMGVPEAAREDVFRLFRRLSKETEGTGVGLAVVRRLLASRGATIRIEDGDDGGSAFVIELPEDVVRWDLAQNDETTSTSESAKASKSESFTT